MYRTHTCSELRLADKGEKVTLAGWVQKSRKLGRYLKCPLHSGYPSLLNGS